MKIVEVHNLRIVFQPTVKEGNTFKGYIGDHYIHAHNLPDDMREFVEQIIEEGMRDIHDAPCKFIYPKS
jgi:hypothetical protein